MENDETVNVCIGPQHFDLLKLIGEGAFGKVLLVRNRLDKELYAMKVISKRLLRKKNNVQYMKSERDILSKVYHPFIVELHFAFQSESKLFLVMDFLSGGELFYHLRKKGIILEKEVRFYLAEMVLAIEFLHNKGVIHRDLKPENVLLRGDGHVCITDFGLAIEIGDGTVVRTLCGTSEYMAPEMLTRNGYGKAVDWWSLGALCYEMLVGKAPFTAKNQKDLDRKILSEKFTVPPYLTANAHSILKGLLEKDMNKRLGASKSTMFQIGGVTTLKKHAFFDNIDWLALERLELSPPCDFRPKPPATNNSNHRSTSPLPGNNNNINSTFNNSFELDQHHHHVDSNHDIESLTTNETSLIDDAIVNSVASGIPTSSVNNNTNNHGNQRTVLSTPASSHPASGTNTPDKQQQLRNNNNNKIIVNSATKSVSSAQKQKSPPDYNNNNTVSSNNYSDNMPLTDIEWAMMNFDAEFTNQHISYSMIDDTLSSHTTTPIRSRMNSHEREREEFNNNLHTKRDNNHDNDSNSDDRDTFKDFEYMNGNFECTVEQLKEFEAELQLKLQKQHKKKLLKQKKEEKAALEMARKKALEEELEKKRKEELQQKLQQEELTRKQREQEQKHKEQLKKQQEMIQQRKLHNQKVAEYGENMNKIQKKLKNLKKKLREIIELEEKYHVTVNITTALTAHETEKDLLVQLKALNMKLSKEQQEKLIRKRDVVDEIYELEQEERELLENSPGELVSEDVPLEKEEAVAEVAVNPTTLVLANPDLASNETNGCIDNNSNNNSLANTIRNIQYAATTPLSLTDKTDNTGTTYNRANNSDSNGNSHVISATVTPTAAQNIATSYSNIAKLNTANNTETISMPNTTSSNNNNSEHNHNNHKHTSAENLKNNSSNNNNSDDCTSKSCECSERLNSATLSKKEFEKNKDEWTTMTSSKSKKGTVTNTSNGSGNNKSSTQQQALNGKVSGGKGVATNNHINKKK